MSGPYRRERRTYSEALRNGGSRPTESRISRVPGWIVVGACLTVGLHLPLDEPHAHSVAGELAGGEQSGRASADN